MFEELVKQAGGPGPFAEFCASKIFQHAAVHHAEVRWSEMSKADQMDMLDQFGGKADALDHLANQAQDANAKGDSSDLLMAVSEMLTNEHPGALGQYRGYNELAKRIAGQITRGYMTTPATG